MKTACVLLAEGFEEVEALTPVDYLRRAEVDVTTAGVTPAPIRGARGISVVPDAGPAALDKDYDCVVVPGGGKGSERLASDPKVAAFLKRHADKGAVIGAICAAPALVLGEACGLLKGRAFTCFPGMESRVAGGTFSEDRVVVDGKLITSRAAGTAGEFSYALINALAGEDAADKLAETVLLF